MSHAIPLHTAERLEHALDALFRRVGARGAKGWLKRIVAFFFCQYCEAVIELLEGLVAEYRAGTLVFPVRVDDPSTTTPAGYETQRHRAAPTRAPAPASSRVRAPRADATSATPERAPEPDAAQHATPWAMSAAPVPAFTRSPKLSPLRRRDHGPPAEKFGRWSHSSMHDHFVTLS